MTEAAQPSSMKQPEVKPNKIADTVLILGALTGTCATIGDKSAKATCHNLLVPLENGNADPIEALADMMIANPGEFDNIVDRFNVLIQKAGERAEEKVNTPNAT
jgi:hypothetical protein